MHNELRDKNHSKHGDPAKILAGNKQPHGAAGKSLLDDLKQVNSELQELFYLYDEFKIFAAFENIPLIMLMNINYATELYNHEINDIRDGLAYHKRSERYAQIQKVISEMYKTLYVICKENNAAKTQIFKGNGLWHLKRLILKFDINTILFLLDLADEINIGVYFSRTFFVVICDTYATILQTVTKTFQDREIGSSGSIDEVPLEGDINEIQESKFEPGQKKKNGIRFGQSVVNEIGIEFSDGESASGTICEDSEAEIEEATLNYPSIDSENFNENPYVYLLLFNSFLNKIFKKRFVDDERFIRNSLAIQEILRKYFRLPPSNSQQPSNKITMIEIILDYLDTSNWVFFGENSKIRALLSKRGQESALFHYFLSKTTSPPPYEKKMLQAWICRSTLKLMNKISQDVVTSQTLKSMRHTCPAIIHSLSNIKITPANWKFLPGRMIAESTMFLSIFHLFPESDLLVDSKFDFSGTDLRFRANQPNFVFFVKNLVDLIPAWEKNMQLEG